MREISRKIFDRFTKYMFFDRFAFIFESPIVVFHRISLCVLSPIYDIYKIVSTSRKDLYFSPIHAIFRISLRHYPLPRFLTLTRSRPVLQTLHFSPSSVPVAHRPIPSILYVMWFSTVYTTMHIREAVMRNPLSPSSVAGLVQKSLICLRLIVKDLHGI